MKLPEGILKKTLARFDSLIAEGRNILDSEQDVTGTTDYDELTGQTVEGAPGHKKRMLANNRPGNVRHDSDVTKRISRIASTIGHGSILIGSRSGVGIGKSPFIGRPPPRVKSLHRLR